MLLKEGEDVSRDEVLAKLVKIHYERNDVGFARGKFRVRGDSFEVWPAYEDYVLRVSLWGDQVEEIVKVDPVTLEVVARLSIVAVYTAHHFTPRGCIERSQVEIADEWTARGRMGPRASLEAFRLRQRTQYVMEMPPRIGVLPAASRTTRAFCPGADRVSRRTLCWISSLRISWCSLTSRT